MKLNKFHKVALRWAARYGSIYRSQFNDYENWQVLPKERWRDVGADGEYGAGRTVPYSVCQTLLDLGYVKFENEFTFACKLTLTFAGLQYCINNRIIKK